MMKEDQEGIKTQAWGCPRHPTETFRESQASKLGDAQGIPFFVNNYQVVSVETMFLLLYILCAVLGASLCFCFLFACWSCCDTFVWERDTLRLFYRMLIMLHLYLLSS